MLLAMNSRYGLPLLVVFISGCGLADYEARMDASLEKHRISSRFHPSVLVGAPKLTRPGDDEVLPITVRWPKRFGAGKLFVPGSEYENSGEIEKERLNPPFLSEFPGLVGMSEDFGKIENLRQFVAYYLYVGAVESGSVKLSALLADLRKEIVAAKLAATEWQDIDVHNEQHELVAWKFLEAKGPQAFFPRSGQEPLRLPGTFHVYAREERGYIVLIAVRIPDDLVGTVPLLDNALGVVGSVQVTGEAEKKMMSDK